MVLMDTADRAPLDFDTVWLGHLHGLLSCPLCGDPSHIGPVLAVHLHYARSGGHDWRPLYDRVYTEWRETRRDLPSPEAMAALVGGVDPDGPPSPADNGPADGQAQASPPSDPETHLRGRIQVAAQRLEDAITTLVRFYSARGRPDLALPHMDRLIRLAETGEQQARWYLGLGGLHERLHDFASAAEMYRRILPLEPADPIFWYFGHNNLGYCLIQLGQFAEAEGYCRRAIEIDPSRHNAHKNLGLALEGQGQHLEAARRFIAATMIWPRDPRALRHLEELLKEHPEIVEQDDELVAGLAECRRLVGTLRAQQFQSVKYRDEDPRS